MRMELEIYKAENGNFLAIRQWIENYDAGKYDSRDTTTQIEAGWCDWFCRDSSLAAKTKKLASKVKQIAKSDKINQDTMYVFFKNNCPMYGSLYDDFRICDIETGNVIYTITPSSGHDSIKGMSSVYHVAGDGFVVDKATWKDVKEYFGV